MNSNIVKVHLIKSSEVKQELFAEVVNLLKAVPGAIFFDCDSDAMVDLEKQEVYFHEVKDAEEFETQLKPLYSKSYLFREEFSFPYERETATWATLFRQCSNYREKKRHITDSEFVILLTGIANDKNWFASLDEEMPFNGFVHTADWSRYIDCSSAFPIAYEVIALTLQKFMFSGPHELATTVHHNPIGCINDMCTKKGEIILKLRTADICRNCMNKVKDKLSTPVIHHALQIMESLRVKMLFAQNFRQESPLSTLVIDRQKRIYLPDFANIEIRLRPLEKALYLLFLDRPEGIYMGCLSDHRQELYDIYTGISNTGMLDEMRARIDDMVNALSNSASEKISRIKRVFEEAIGSDLAQHYYVKGAVGEAKSIALDRDKIERQ